MTEHTFDKTNIRKQLRQQRRNLPDATQLAAAKAVTECVARLPDWTSVRRAALYIARDGEIDTAALSSMCRTAGMQLFLPVVDRYAGLVFAEWTLDGSLVNNRYGIPEPTDDAPRCSARHLDLIVLPLVAWDRHGTRLGMGSGFYDRALEGVKGPLLVGLSHALQQVPQLPRDDWDVSLDFVVTDTALHSCKAMS